MARISVFDNIRQEDVKRLLSTFNSRTIVYKKGRTVLSNLINVNQLGIIISGSANIIKYDINGNLVIIESLNENDVFGSIFSSKTMDDLSLITTSDSEIIFIDYDNILDKCTKKNDNYNILISNMFNILSNKITEMDNRIDILTKRTIRDKLIKYFEYECARYASSTFILPFSYTSLADYLAIDRSAMMREIRYLKDEGFLYTNKRKIKFIKY